MGKTAFKNERGFLVDKTGDISKLIEGDQTSINFSDVEKNKNVMLRVHYHPSNYIVPSLADMFNELSFSIIQNRKSLIPYFGILAVDNEPRQKGAKYHEMVFPELLVYSYGPLVSKYAILLKYPVYQQGMNMAIHIIAFVALTL